jgi:hypothetical protein
MAPPRRQRMLHPWVNESAAAALEAEAVRRGMHSDALAGELIEHVARDDLFAAVIDAKPRRRKVPGEPD